MTSPMTTLNDVLLNRLEPMTEMLLGFLKEEFKADDRKHTALSALLQKLCKELGIDPGLGLNWTKRTKEASVLDSIDRIKAMIDSQEEVTESFALTVMAIADWTLPT